MDLANGQSLFRAFFESIDLACALGEIEPDGIRILAANAAFDRELLADDAEIRPQVESVLATGVPARTDEVCFLRVGPAGSRVFAVLARDARAKKSDVSQERLRLIVESATEYGILSMDRDRRIDLWSPGAAAIFGFSETEMISRSADEIFTPEDRVAGVPAQESALARRDGRAFDERWHMRKDGSRFFGSGVMSPLGPNAAHGYVKMLRDMTERRAAEAAIRESRERLRLALGAARMGIWSWDTASDSHTRDENLNRLLGLDAVESREPLSQFLQERVHLDDRAMVADVFSLALRKRQPLQIEFRVVWPNGVVRWLRDQGDVFAEAADTPTYMMGACVDVTDLKAAEEALRDAHDKLEERVRERTGELARINEARVQLLRKVVTAQEDERRRVSRELHDGLGQELTALSLSLKHLELELPDRPEGRERMREVEAIVARIVREAHDLAVELRPTALDDLGLVPALATYAARWAKRTAVELDFEALGLDEERLPAEMETTIYRIVQEALNNVVKHASATRVSVIVERRGEELSAVIEDDGRGFDRAALGAAASDRASLGLLGMEERAALVGGSVLVESEPNEGTMVRVRIPLVR